MPDIQLKYGAASSLTVTGLNSLASSSDFTAGWTSGWVDNTTTLALDYLAQFQVTTGSTPTAGSIRVYVYSEFPDGTDPDLFSSGTEGSVGAATVRDTEMLNSGLVLVWVTDTDTTTNDPYPSPARSVAAAFGQVPRKFAFFISHNTGVNLSASGNVVQVDPILNQY